VSFRGCVALPQQTVANKSTNINNRLHRCRATREIVALSDQTHDVWPISNTKNGFAAMATLPTIFSSLYLLHHSAQRT
jgi:hypothetical protein